MWSASMPSGTRSRAPNSTGMATTVNFCDTSRAMSCAMYSDSGPSTTHTMKLKSKYKNAASSVGQWPLRRKS